MKSYLNFVSGIDVDKHFLGCYLYTSFLRKGEVVHTTARIDENLKELVRKTKLLYGNDENITIISFEIKNS